MFVTLVAYAAAIAVTGTVAAFLPHTDWGRFLTNVVFFYALAPAARRSFWRNAPEGRYWMFAALGIAVTALVDHLVKPPFVVAAAVVAFCVGGPLVAWIVSQMKTP